MPRVVGRDEDPFAASLDQAPKCLLGWPTVVAVARASWCEAERSPSRFHGQSRQDLIPGS